MVYFGGFFAKLGPFAGFSLHIVNFVGRISEAAMKGVGDILFHNFGAQWKGTPSYCDFLLVFFHIIRRKDQGGHNMINMTIRELYYIFADFFQN